MNWDLRCVMRPLFRHLQMVRKLRAGEAGQGRPGAEGWGSLGAIVAVAL